MLGVVVAVFLLSGALLVVQDGDEGQPIGTSGGAIIASASVTTVIEPAIAEPPATTSSTVAASPPSPPGPSPTTTTPRRPVATTVATTAPAQTILTSTTVPAPSAAAAGPATTSVPATVTAQPATTTSTTVPACRNSTDPKCGPFRFDPQPGADNPMAVGVTVEPASPVAGQRTVFHITLTDPDGVSYDGTTFNFGNGGIGGSTPDPCAKYGPWDPPAPNPASATETMDLGHTYFEAGTYTATFFFDAGPFDCVDAVSGRGDRPYASSATGTVTVQVSPAP